MNVENILTDNVKRPAICGQGASIFVLEEFGQEFSDVSADGLSFGGSVFH